MKDKLPNGNFMKAILLLSFVNLCVFTLWQMVVFTITGNEAETLIQWFFTFWGLEVSLLMLKKMVEYHGHKNDYDDDEEDY